jgi:integrase
VSEPSERKIEGAKPVRKRLANGDIRIYWYHRDTGSRLPDNPDSPEFMRALKNLDSEKLRDQAAEKGNTISSLIRTYKASPDWTGLAASTREIESYNLTAIENEWGTMTLRAVGLKGARAEFLEWRNELAEKTPRAADAKLKRMAKLFSFALDLELIERHPLLKLKSVYESDRSDIIWSDQHITRFRGSCGPDMGLALLIALHTGQRRGDILGLRWANYDGFAISLRQGKTKTDVFIPCTTQLRDALDARKAALVSGNRRAEDLGDETILLNTEGNPWTKSAFRSAWDRAFEKTRIDDDIHFHDLRGTAVTRLAEASCTVPEIATITGHSLTTVTKILERYLARSQTLSRSAISKLQASIDTGKSAGRGAEALSR